MSGPVTTEATWQAWRPLAALPVLARPDGRVVVVSAHPDDEVLGAGGLIAVLADADVDVRFVTVTDGEASHPEAPMSPAVLAGRRSAELVAALALLGVADAPITRLRLPDSGLGPHLPQLRAELRRVPEGADLVVCPAAVDGHADHATVGQATLDVCRGRAPVWQYPIWMWHWTTPPGSTGGEHGVQWERAGRFELTAAPAARKRTALQCFATQVAALPGDPTGDVILPPQVLMHFERPYEIFFT